MSARPDPEDPLLAELAEQYPLVKRLDDGSIAAVCPLMFTTSVLLGCTRFGYERRFCFEGWPLALEAFGKLKTEDDELTGFIASRGR